MSSKSWSVILGPGSTTFKLTVNLDWSFTDDPSCLTATKTSDSKIYVPKMKTHPPNLAI